MAIIFPANPGINEEYTFDNVTYIWDGEKWTVNNTATLSEIYVNKSGDTMTGGIDSGSTNNQGYFICYGDGKTYGYIYGGNSDNDCSVALNYKNTSGGSRAFIIRDPSGTSLADIDWTGAATFAGTITAANFVTTGGGSVGGGTKVAYLWDEKPSGTNGGSVAGGIWEDRTLNTKEDANNLVVLSGNEFTLAAGEYQIEWNAPAAFVNNHQTKLKNVTTGTTQKMGSSEYSSAGGGGSVTTRSLGFTTVNISSSTTYKIEHRCGSTYATYGFGFAGSSGEPEVYTQVKITGNPS